MAVIWKLKPQAKQKFERPFLSAARGYPRLRVEDLAMWGGTMAVLRSELTLDTVDLLFPTANRRVLDETGMLRAVRKAILLSHFCANFGVNL
jgi:hypothetical protein